MVHNPNLLIPIPAVPKHLLARQNSSGPLLSPALSPQQPHPSPFPWTTVAPASSQGYIHDSGIGSDFARSPSSGSRTPSGFEFLDWGTREGGQERGRSFDWDIYASPNAFTTQQRFKRRLGPTEVSYYLGSRGDGGHESGVNDMYLHIGFKAPPALMTRDRLLSIWTELTQRHALLACTVEFDSLEEMRFCYDPLSTYSQRQERAERLTEFRCEIEGDAVVDSYLNGPRLLSDDRLSTLIISTPAPTFASLVGDDLEQQYHFTLATTHFLGDGMALHLTGNEFFLLLAGSPSSPSSAAPNQALDGASIESVLAAKAGGELKEGVAIERMALAMESKLSTTGEWGRFAWAAAKVEFQGDQDKLVGGHAFPRAYIGKRNTLVPTVSYSLDQTSRILKNCKSQGVTIAHAVFALSNIAFIDSVPALDREDEFAETKGKRDERLPCMLYSAMNLRPWLTDGGMPDADWFHIAIGYYNIILPSFLPSTSTPTAVFWNRALSTRKQTSKVVKSRWLPSRAKLMALERERRSIGFEREDERRRVAKSTKREMEKGMAGLGIGEICGMENDAKIENPVKIQVSLDPTSPVVVVVEKKPKVPSVALMGVSMLGNLDGMYKHAQYHRIRLTSLNTGSRQRPGGLLLFAYTFVGKLWFSLGYDVNGFEAGVVEKWWKEVQVGVDNFLLV